MSVNDESKPELTLSKEAEAILHVSNMQDAYSGVLLVQLNQIHAMLHVILGLEKIRLVNAGADLEELNADIKESLATFETNLAKGQVALLKRIQDRIEKAQSEHLDR